MQCLHLWNTPPPYLGQTPLLNMQIFYSCIVSANRQLNFSLSLTKVGWHEFEKKIVVATTARRNISNDGPSSSEWGLTKPIFMNQKFWMARYHLNYGSPIIIPRYISNRKINGRKNFWSEKKRTAVSGCQLRAGEKKRPKLLPEKLLRPADNPPNLPSVQNNRFLLSGFLHFFPFSGKSPEFWCRTIYGTLYYLPHHHHILKKKEKNTKFTILQLFWVKLLRQWLHLLNALKPYQIW